MSSPLTMSAAATCLIKAPASILSGCQPSRRSLQITPHQCRAMLDQFSVFIREGRRSMAVNVEFADHVTLHEHRRHNLRSGLEGARKIAQISVDVVNHNGLPCRDGGAANSL